VDVGGAVDAMLLAEGFLFAGFRKGSEGIIKVYNLATATDHILTGHKVRLLYATRVLPDAA